MIRTGSVQKSVFITGIFILLFFIHFIYFRFKFHFEDKTMELSQAIRLKKTELEQEKLRHKLTVYQMNRFKSEVALALKDINQLHSLKSFHSKNSIRTFASLVSDSVENQLESRMFESLFHKAKRKYKEKKYSEAIESLNQFIEVSSFSPQVVEAYYLLVESFFSLNRLEDCIRTVQLMVRLFPENDFTGFSIFKMGELYKRRKEVKEATEVFEVIRFYFSSNKKLALLVNEALKSL